MNLFLKVKEYILNLILKIIPFTSFKEKIMKILFLQNANALKPIKSIYGDFFYLNPQDSYINPMMYWTKQYDSSQTFWAVRIFSMFCNSFFDFGANIGWFTVTLGKYFKEKGPVVAVEPDPISFHFLEKNVKANHIKANLENLAISSESGKQNFYQRKIDKGGNSLFKYDNSSYLDGEVEVKTSTINNLIEKYNPPEPILVKMDIEGYEYFAFKAIQRLLEKECVIVTEITPKFIKKMGKDPREILDTSRNFGYTIYQLETGKKIEENEFDSLCAGGQINLLLVKSKFWFDSINTKAIKLT